MTKCILITGSAGYIGSALYQHLDRRMAARKDIYVSGCDYRGSWSSEPDYRNVPMPLADWDVIVHLAAHSSVRACQTDPAGAWANNVTGFAALLDRLHPSQRLIYASSGSVYHGAAPAWAYGPPKWAMTFDRQYGPEELEQLRASLARSLREPHVFAMPAGATIEPLPCVRPSRESDHLAPPLALYDLTKRTMDDLARLSGKDCYGLRLGTVCGPSPTMRDDLMINAMVKAAREQGFIEVRNGPARRAILGMDDCVRTIEAIIDYPERAPGVYNVASFNSTVQGIAERVGRMLEARFNLVSDTPHYDFALDIGLVQRTFGVSFAATVESIVQDLVSR